MDTNVIGRKRIDREPEFERPRVERLIVRDLSEETHGTPSASAWPTSWCSGSWNKIDWHVTNTNSMVSGFLQRSMFRLSALRTRPPSTPPTSCCAAKRRRRYASCASATRCTWSTCGFRVVLT